MTIDDIIQEVSNFLERVNKEVDIPYAQEIEEYKRTHKEPYWPRGDKYKKYRTELDVIHKKWQSCQLAVDFNKLKNVLPCRTYYIDL